MSKPKHADPRDAVEEALVALAERLGAAWHRGPPLDGWALHRGVWMPVEIKAPEREGLKYEYTPQQIRFFAWCRIRNGRWWVWRSEDDVIRNLGGRRAA
jgi:hypothetical protein